MVKPRRDLQYRYSRILRSIRDERMNCLPVYSRSASLGADPTVIYNFGPGPRLHQPFLATRTRRKRKDNRTSLPPGPYSAIYKPIGKKSPLREVLKRNDPAEMRENFIIVENGVPKVKIFMIVKDLSAALRQTEHILAQYNRESDELTKERWRKEERLRTYQFGLETLSDEEALQTRLEIAAINYRLAQVHKISTDRVARDLALRFVVRESFERLAAYSRWLENLARSISRMGRRFRRKQVADYLNSLSKELTFFASKEVRPHRSLARREMNRIIRDDGQLNYQQVIAIITRARLHLENASKALVRWSDTLNEKEVRAAQEMRLSAIGAST